MKMIGYLRNSILLCALLAAPLAPVQAQEADRETDDAWLGIMVLCPGTFYHLGLDEYQDEFNLSLRVLEHEIAYRQDKYGESKSDLYDALGRMLKFRGANNIDDVAEASISHVGKNLKNVSPETQLSVFKECLTLNRLTPL